MSETSGVVVSEPKTSSKRAPVEEGNLKETIESILVAFILAFIFRAFVVEAFVIPTGSMAPTLLGAHMRYTCPDCGYTFDVNYSSPRERDSEEMRIPSEDYPIVNVYCPNCGYEVAQARDPRNPTPPPPQPVNYGDRILVLKYLYLLHPPRRWDVVVFKSPDNPRKDHYQQNFIKRLVGLPGEKLMVLDGDVYIADATHPDWSIPKKTWEAAEPLWRIIYDNDFHPQQLSRSGMMPWMQPWRQVAGLGWETGKDAATGRTFRADDLDGSGTLRFDPNANSTSQTVTDYLAYDLSPMRGFLRRPGTIGSNDDANANPVSDLKIAAYYTRLGGDGPFRVKLSRFESVDHTFTTEITRETVRLLHRSNTGEIVVREKKLAELGLDGNKPLFIEMSNADYRVQLHLNGKEAFDPFDYDPNVEWLMQQWKDKQHSRPGEAQIEADHQTCTITHLGLWRDVYYTNRRSDNTPLQSAAPFDPVTLGPAEYFVMGDNSAVSEDARWWSAPIDLPNEGLVNVKEGRVPEQFMLGKAVFVYWPAGYRPLGHLSIIPNFGDMRFIK